MRLSVTEKNKQKNDSLDLMNVVAADAGSTYDPYPTLKYCWDPKNPAQHHRHPTAQVGDLGPHPADPMAQHYGQAVDDLQLEGPNVLEQRVLGTELYVYGGRSGYVRGLTSS